MSIDQIPLPNTAGALYLTSLREVAPDPEAILTWAGDDSTVVCLNHLNELQQRWPTYLEWLREHRGGRALWYPTANLTAPTVEAARPALDRILERLGRGGGVVMHCAMGRGRAGTMAVCASMMAGAPMGESLRTVARNRLYAGPIERSQWALVEAINAAVNPE